MAKAKKAKNPQPVPKHSGWGTSALLEYRWAAACDRQLFHFVCDMVLRADYVSYVAKQALNSKADYKKISPSELARTKPGINTRRLRHSSQELLEMFICRAVDNFEIYLVEVIRLALLAQPRILADRKQELTLGHILKFDTIEALSRDIIEGKLTSLSYDGFGAVEEWCQSRAIPLLVPNGRRNEVIELIATRNIIVHSRGIVDERFRSAVPTSAFNVGDKRELDVEDWHKATKLLDDVTTITDAAVAGKFQLKTVNINKLNTARWKKRWPKLKDEDTEDKETKDLVASAESAAAETKETPTTH